MNVKLYKEDRIKVHCADDLFGVMQRILLREDVIDQDREHFWVVGLANNNRIIYVELISLGTINQTLVSPMEVFSFALQKRAVKVMLVHNHPSGDLLPSDDDRDITDRLIQSGLLLNTVVLDHLVISTRSFVSFAAIGLMDELNRSKKYVPPFRLIENIKKEAAEMARRKEKVEIAKELKRDGIAIDRISNATGLSLEEVEKLRVRVRKKKKTEGEG